MVPGILRSGPDGFLAPGPTLLWAAHDAPPVTGNGSLHSPAGRFSFAERSFNLRFRVSRTHGVDNIQHPGWDPQLCPDHGACVWAAGDVDTISGGTGTKTKAPTTVPALQRRIRIADGRKGKAPRYRVSRSRQVDGRQRPQQRGPVLRRLIHRARTLQPSRDVPTGVTVQGPAGAASQGAALLEGLAEGV
jgi:hypothetical protein